MALKKAHPSLAEEQAKETFDRLPKPKKREPQVKKKKENMKAVNFRIGQTDYELLVNYCQNEYGLGSGAALRFAIREFLKNHKVD